MPYDWVEPGRVLTHRGVTVYELYDNDQVQEGAMENWFTLDSTASADDGKDEGVFDIRDLPEVPEKLQKKYGMPGEFPHDEDEGKIKYALDIGYFAAVLDALEIELKPLMYAHFWKHIDPSMESYADRISHLLTIIPRDEFESILENMGVYEEENEEENDG